jgi:hypothetical protein
MNLRRPWTPEDEQELLELAARGASKTLMSARLKRSRMAIEGRLTVLRARARNATIETRTTAASVQAPL